MKQTLILDWLPTDLNTYIDALNAHRMKGAQIKKDETERVWAECKVQGLKPMKGKVFIKYFWYTPRRLDPDNIRFASKYINDGLVRAGVIKDDSLKYIAGLADEFIVDTADQVTIDISTYDE